MTTPEDLPGELSERVARATPELPPPYADVLARRARRRTRRRMLASSVAVTVGMALVAGIAVVRHDPDDTGSQVATDRRSDSPSAPTGTGSQDPSAIPDVAPDWDPEQAPPVVLHLDGREVRLQPWSYCYGGICADGSPQRPFEDAGDRGVVQFAFPLTGWHFTETFTPLADGRCERAITHRVEPTGEHTFAVAPVGPPGDYQVDLFGQGPGGEIATTFAWTTTESGFLPAPSGYVGMVSDDGDDFIAYPVEMGLDGLSSAPRHASLTLTVTAADGASRSVGPIIAQQDCRGVGAGSVFFEETPSGGEEPLDLGPGPFTYRAEVTLDGTTYVGTAVWPRDERADEAPYTDLTFDPPLPGYTG